MGHVRNTSACDLSCSGPAHFYTPVHPAFCSEISDVGPDHPKPELPSLTISLLLVCDCAPPSPIDQRRPPARKLRRTRRRHAARAAPWPAPVCGKATNQLGGILVSRPPPPPPPPALHRLNCLELEVYHYYSIGPSPRIARCRRRRLSSPSSPLPAGSASPLPVRIVSTSFLFSLPEKTLLSNGFIVHAMESSVQLQKIPISALWRQGLIRCRCWCFVRSSQEAWRSWPTNRST